MKKDLVYKNVRKDYYLIDEKGNVYIKKTGKKRKTFKNTSGYTMVQLVLEDTKGMSCFFVHRLVQQTFSPIEDFELYEVNHIRGKEYGNDAAFLEWSTCRDNMRHAYAIGLIIPKKGETSPVTDFSNTFVHTLCEILETCYDFDDILTELQSSGFYMVTMNDDIKKLKNLIGVIRGELAWCDISSKYSIIRNPKKRFGVFGTEENIERVCELICEKKSAREIAIEIFGSPKSGFQNVIRSIKNNRTYRYISKKFW